MAYNLGENISGLFKVSAVSLQRKWSGTKFLSSEKEFTSCLTILGLGSYEISRESLACLELMAITQSVTLEANFDSYAKKLR